MKQLAELRPRRAARGGVAVGSNAVASWLLGENPINGEDAVAGLLASLPDSAAVIPTIADEVTQALLLKAQLRAGANAGAGAAFGYLDRGLNAAKAQFAKDLAKCRCC